jgi:hypothetical protein
VLAVRQAAPDDADSLPVVVMPIAGAAFQAQLTQTTQCIASGIGLAGSQCLGAVINRMQHAAFFHGEDKDQPVDKAQQLLEVGVLAQAAVVQRGARIVGGCCRKPSPR